jgi:signal transduction histidine kinase/CheY-like chemotaxis protein/CHASE3 domain sensor protein
VASSARFFGVVTHKWANLSLRMKGLVFFSIPMTALLVSGGLLYRLEREKSDAELRTNRALEMRAQLQNMYIFLISAESEIRNYALNGQEDGLQPFGLAGATADALFAKIREVEQDNAGQKARLARTEELVHARLKGLTELREYYQSAANRGTPPPGDLRARARISPDVLLVFTEFATNESKLVQEWRKASTDRQTNLRNELIASTVLSLLAGLLTVMLFSQGIARRMKILERNASRVGEGLQPDAPCPGTDELGRLARAIEKAGAAGAERTEELKLALEGGKVLIWKLDPDSRSIRYHAGADTVHGAIPAELLPGTVDAWIAGVHHEDREHVKEELNRIVSKGGGLEIEYRLAGAGGAVRWMVVKAQSYVVGTGQRRLLGVLADITDRKAASEEIERQARELNDSKDALQRQTRILQSILNSMGDGVVVADTLGKFLVFNPAARQMLGVVHSFGADTDQWAQHHGLFLPDTVTLYPSDELPFVRAIRGESVDDVEIFVLPAGVIEGKWVSVTARPLREDDGAIRGGVVVIRDVTAPKRAAEALELARRDAETANQAKSEFLSRMSHELRTPLNSILGFAQLLELENLGDQGADNVYHILKGGYHLLELINEILDLARIEAGRITLSLEAVPVREALQDALDLVRPLAIEKHIIMNPDMVLGCAHHVHADRQRLKQVLLNLLSNAIKFNRPNGMVVISCQDSGNRRLRLEVVDTGMGISTEGLKRIFRPFERLDADRTEAGGTGLGLALSKRLVEAMGGTIGVESAVGLGSRFFIELALRDDPAARLEGDADAGKLMSLAAVHQQGMVLYIEDNSSNLRLVEKIFANRAGVQLLTAMQGLVGLDLAELHTPDWILLDLHLPDIAGEEVLRRLRANPRTANIPVTVLSADATSGQINRLMRAGARDYLTKPLDVRKLVHLLDSTISHSEPSASEVQEAYAERDYSK